MEDEELFSHMVNNMVADNLAMQGAKASAAVVLIV